MRRVALALALLAGALAAYALVRHFRRAYTSTRGAQIVHFTLHSRDVGRDLDELLVVPPRHGSTLLVLLHGRGVGPSSWLSQPFFDELRALGRRAPTVLILDGGDHSYWHDRADGRWGTMVLREAIPAGVVRTHAARIAIGGISMGGFGALDLGMRGRFCAVGAHSPALWADAGRAAPGAFDDAADFTRHDLLSAARRRALYGSRVWIDVGADDPFVATDTTFARLLAQQDEALTFHVWPGGHERSYWRAHVAQYLRFYAAACR